MIIKEKRIVKDEQGLPNYMTAFFWTGSKDPAEAPPMFVVCGEVVDAIMVSQFVNANIGGIPCSLPFQMPWTGVSHQKADALCRKKGKGWHLLTNTEYAYLLKESRELGTEPHGNTNYGKDYDYPDERGIICDHRYTLTGLDPVTWSHDHTENGVFGLKGNVWEHVQGLRLKHGKVQYIKNNDAAAAEVDTGADSTAWESVRLDDGRTVKLDFKDDTIVVTAGEVEEKWGCAEMAEVKLDGLETVPQALYDLEILPPDYQSRHDGIFVDSDMAEVVPFRGSSFLYTSLGGASAVSLNYGRSNVNTYIGFRSALYLKYSKPMTD